MKTLRKEIVYNYKTHTEHISMATSVLPVLFSLSPPLCLVYTPSLAVVGPILPPSTEYSAVLPDPKGMLIIMWASIKKLEGKVEKEIER